MPSRTMSLSKVVVWIFTFFSILLECVRKSVKRFSDKTHDKTKIWSPLLFHQKRAGSRARVIWSRQGR